METINVFEYSKSHSEIKSNKDSIGKYFSKFKNDKPIAILEYDGTIRNLGPWVGIITYKEHQFNFKSKLDKNQLQESNLFYMLSYLNNLESIHIDLKNYSTIKEGKLFFDVLGKIFVSDFKNIFKKGLLKKYIRYQEKIGFLKGKLLVKKQANQFIQNKFNCEFDDLTYNNLENQAILLTANILSNFVKNDNLKIELKRIINILEDEISLNKNINRDDLKKIKFNRLNSYYKKIIEVSEYIITKKFISNIHQEKNFNCCNFVVDMNKVYENFITNIFEEIIREEEYSNKFKILSQSSVKTLVKNGKKITTKPDLVITKNNKPIFLLDIKYKHKKIPNGDFYQMCAYSLAYPDVKEAFLLYEDLDEKEKYSEIYKDINNEDTNIKINYIKLNLKEILNQELSKDEFKLKVINKLKIIIKEQIIKNE